MRRSILILPISLGVFEDLLTAVAHAFQAAADRVDRRSHAALEHGHREADRTAPRGWVASGRHRLVFDVAGQLVVEIEFLAVEIKGGRADLTIGKQLTDLSGLGMWKADQCLFGATQVEGGLVFAYCLLKAFDAAVDIRVKQSEESAKMVRIPLVRRGRHQEEVVGHLRQVLAQAVGVGLVVFATGAHLVSLVDDGQIPAGPQQAFAGVFDHRHPGNRGNDLVALLPRVLAVVGSQNVAADDVESLAELVGDFRNTLSMSVSVVRSVVVLVQVPAEFCPLELLVRSRCRRAMISSLVDPS
jgi:hypothetical protein